MPTEEWQVEASHDDCMIRRSSESIWLDFAQLRIGEYSDAAYDYESAARFLAITIPQGATITSAFIKLRSGGYEVKIPTIHIYGEDADDTATFTTYANWLARFRTDAMISWTPPAWVSGTWYTSLDIKTIIQEIVNREGWESGNAIVIFLQQTLGWEEYQIMFADTFDANETYAAKLEVTWSVGPTQKSVSGSIIASGSLLTGKKLTVSGSIGASGAFVRDKDLTLFGSITTLGTLLTDKNLTIQGLIDTLGIVEVLKRNFIDITGIITASGEVRVLQHMKPIGGYIPEKKPFRDKLTPMGVKIHEIIRKPNKKS